MSAPPRLTASAPTHRHTLHFPPSWNAAPTDLLPVVRYDRKAGERSLDLLRWGLIPHWAKDLNVVFANINAKAEGIENKPAFRDAFQRRRQSGKQEPVRSPSCWKRASFFAATRSDTMRCDKASSLRGGIAATASLGGPPMTLA